MNARLWRAFAAACCLVLLTLDVAEGVAIRDTRRVSFTAHSYIIYSITCGMFSGSLINSATNFESHHCIFEILRQKLQISNAQ
jgi:hypothetical protein